MFVSLFCFKTSNGSHLPLFKSRLLTASRTADLIVSQPPVACLPHCPTHCPLVHKGHLYMLFLPQHTLPPAPSTSAFALMLMSQLSCHLLQEESPPPTPKPQDWIRAPSGVPLYPLSPITVLLLSWACPSRMGACSPPWERGTAPAYTGCQLHAWPRLALYPIIPEVTSIAEGKTGKREPLQAREANTGMAASCHLRTCICSGG